MAPAAARLRSAQARQKDFLDKTGLKRQYGREQIGDIVTGRNPFFGINTPLIASKENRDRKYLENLLSKKVRLRRKHKDVIVKIPSRGDWAYFGEDKVHLEDLAALTCATKDEFALFSGAGRSLVIHGGTRWNIPQDAWDEIRTQQLIWVGHSHPTTTDISASIEDRETLQNFFTWQEKSAIIDMTGTVKPFSNNPQDWFNDFLGVK